MAPGTDASDPVLRLTWVIIEVGCPEQPAFSPKLMINQDHFQLLGLPERFETDLSALERGFRAVQSSVHPDRFVRAMDSERRMAMQLSTQVNEAYRVLSNPIERAQYLCKRHGVSVDTDRGAGLSPDFLEEQMQWRERLDEGGNESQVIEELRVELADAQSRRVASLQQLIDHDGNYEAAAQLSREMMFIEKFRQSVESAARAS